MASVPSQRELDETIARMTARFAKTRGERATQLLNAYASLSARFADDLSDRRDIALSRAALLMMVRYLLEEKDAGSSKEPT